jgi:glycosyltransferase involved in cell wall biosynthesis
LFKIPKDSNLFWSPQYNVPLLTNIPLVVTIHDLLHLKILFPDFGFVKRLVSKFFFYVCSVKARLIFFNSFFTRNEFLSLFNYSVDRCQVTHLAVDQQLFQNNVSAEVINFNYFLMIGNIKPHKNFEFAIPGFLEFSKNYDCKLVIIGRYENFITTSKSTLELINQNRDRIIFLGKISNNELINYLESSLGLIFPSIYEGFGLPPLEAMSLGVPIIASFIPTTLEICGEELPFYFHLNDSEKYIEQLNNVFTLSDDEKYILKNKMQFHVNRFSWDKCSKLTIENFLKII